MGQYSVILKDFDLIMFISLGLQTASLQEKVTLFQVAENTAKVRETISSVCFSRFLSFSHDICMPSSYHNFVS